MTDSKFMLTCFLIQHIRTSFKMSQALDLHNIGLITLIASLLPQQLCQVRIIFYVNDKCFSLFSKVIERYEQLESCFLLCNKQLILALYTSQRCQLLLIGQVPDFQTHAVMFFLARIFYIRPLIKLDIPKLHHLNTFSTHFYHLS